MHEGSSLGAAVPAGVGQVKLVLGAGNAYIKKAAFFFQPGQVSVINDPLVRKHAVAQADQEDDRPFQSLGLVDSGQSDGAAGEVRRGAFIIRVAQKGKLGKKILRNPFPP